MRLFERWLGRESEQESAAENIERLTFKSNAKHGQETDAEYEDDASFSWLGTNQSFGNVPDALRGTDDERSATDTMSLRTLAITDDATYTVEEKALKLNDSEKETDDDTVPTRTLSLAEDPTSTFDEDEGVDPYNTGRFDTAKS